MHWFTFSPNDFFFAFLSVLFEGLPFLLLGSLISGVVDVFLPADTLARVFPKNAALAIPLSALLGIIPVCECGSVVVIRRFIRKGLPLPCAITYMLAAPIVNPLVAMSTFIAFRGQNPLQMLGYRLSLGYLIAVGAGFIVLLLRKSPRDLLQPGLIAEASPKRSGLRWAATDALSGGQKDFAEIAMGASPARKLILAVQSATADFLDVAFFFILGTAIACLFNTAVNQQLILPFATQPILAILVLMGLAIVVSLCSTTDAFIAASFSSFPQSAKLAFLLLGPVFDLKLFWLYGLILRRKFVCILGASLIVVIAFICWRAGAVIDGVRLP